MDCSIGIYFKRKCGGNKLYTLKQFSTRQWTLFKLRSGVGKLKNVCDKHADRYGHLYSVSIKVCCNPLDLHVKPRHKSLITISPDFHNKHHQFAEQVIEGRKLCLQCYKAVGKRSVKLPSENEEVEEAGSCFLFLLQLFRE